MGKNQYSYWEITVRDTGIEGLLNALSESEVAFFAPRLLDEVSLSLCVPYGQIGQLRSIVERRGGELRLCKPKGILPAARRLSKRYALIVTLFVCAMLLGVSNLFVWRIEVSGNETVPTGAVLRAMEEAEAGIGSFWPAFRGEQLKTELLLRLKVVQWVAVNYGRGAVEVVLRERRAVPDVVDNDEPVHIVAQRDAVGAEMSVKQGKAAVGIGDTVEKGQLLISGAPISTMGKARTVHALGSVRGRTWHTVTVRMPLREEKKAYVGHRSLKISMILGGRRVKFYRNSSIFGDTCDTITMDYHLCMDDVFSLPVRFAVQRCEYWEGVTKNADGSQLTEYGRETLHEALCERIGERGTVVTERFAAQTGAEAVTVTVMAECLEEIGIETPISEEELRRMNTLREEAVND